MIQHSRTYVAAPPGFTVKEMIDDRGITEGQLAVRMGKDETFVRDLIEGEVELTQEVAQQLESELGMNARFWLNLERLYHEALAKVKEENANEAAHKTKPTIRIQTGLVASG